jgi:2-oxoisovalerate dehydrogenase E1 component
MTRMARTKTASEAEITLDELKDEILRDYALCITSREASLIGRKEVLGGRAKFGIFGDGKELAQVCMAKQFRNGDWRSGYYRDMTFMFAIGELTVQQWFAQLYAHADVNADPSSAGRSMNGHFATRSLDANGEWRNLMAQPNSSPDISPTGGQMPRLLGLAHASKMFRENHALHGHTHLSDKGNEVAFGTIGDASTSEGHFWETINAAGVLQVPMAMSVWDDGWGISVSKDHQTTKGSISKALAGFEKEDNTNGLRIYRTKGWDYAHLNRTYEQAIALCREEHVPCLIHVEEVTQPQGHSTSGSHERYKSNVTAWVRDKDGRPVEQVPLLDWYKVYDCNVKFREWILNFRPGGSPLATAGELDALEANARAEARAGQKAAWAAYQDEMKAERGAVLPLIEAIDPTIAQELRSEMAPGRKEIISAARRALLGSPASLPVQAELSSWVQRALADNADRYGSHLYSESAKSCLNVPEVPVR